MKGKMRFLAVALIALLMIWCSCEADGITKRYSSSKHAYHQVQQFKPQNELPTVITTESDDTKVGFVNEDIVRLKEQFSDAIGWLSVDNTIIDYPFVQAADNDYYLHRNLEGDYLYPGSIFIDYRNYGDVTDSNTIFYGHNMKDESMFTSLKRFADKGFFDNNKQGKIYLSDKTLQITFFAYMYIVADDAVIYGMNDYHEDAVRFLAYVRDNALYYREGDYTPQDRFVTLSTCVNATGAARMVLIGKLYDN